MTIPCTFTYPQNYHTNDVKVYWKRNERASFKTGDKDDKQFVFHTNQTFVVEKYRGRTQLIGNANDGNCSLKIEDVKDNEKSLYVRIIVQDHPFSFTKKPVSISVSGENISKVFYIWSKLCLYS